MVESPEKSADVQKQGEPQLAVKRDRQSAGRSDCYRTAAGVGSS